MSTKAIVIGSGAGGSTAAMVLAKAGIDVTILEKGPNWFGDLKAQNPHTVFSNDELKGNRSFALPDPDAEPRTYRWHPTDTTPRATGAIQALPQTVGGGTVHWDAKTPRFWDIDFRKHSMLGPITGAEVADWPFAYDEIAPYYNRAERLIGVAGNVDEIASRGHAPRDQALPMPGGPPQYSSLLCASGARDLGLHPFIAAMAINSTSYDGRPACNNCGFCANYGCPIMARIGALAPLREALRAGAELRANACAVHVNVSGTRARSVTWADDHNHTHTEKADMVVMAALAIETSRLAALSVQRGGLPDPNDTIGRFFMQHWFTDGSGIFLDQRPHADRGRSTTHVIDDFADPDFPGASDAARAAGLPYFRGGTCELGGTQSPIGEAGTYRLLLPVVAPDKPFGTSFKELMRSSILRDRMMGIQLIGEDLPYATNRVDLDPTTKDWRGLPAARITYSPGPHEIAAQNFYRPWVAEILRRAGAQHVTAVADAASDQTPFAGSNVPTTAHVMGGMRMGDDPRTSSTDSVGRYHHVDNLFVADGSVFPGAGGHNPTLTIMATAWRNADHWT